MKTFQSAFKYIFLAILFSLTIFSFVPVTNQPPTRPFLAHLKAMNMTFRMPGDCVNIFVRPGYSCGEGKFSNAITYTIRNRDSSIAIGFSFIGMPDPNTLAMIKGSNPAYNPNNNYLITAKNTADTINHKLIFYSKEYSKAIFNADDAGEYVRVCPIPYSNRYLNRKIVFIFKKDRGHAEITYFYTERAKYRIDEYIKQTSSMLKFND
jgi:hypothetical protein